MLKHVSIVAGLVAATICAGGASAAPRHRADWGDASPLIVAGPLESALEGLATVKLCTVGLPLAGLSAAPVKVPSFALAQRHASALVRRGRGAAGMRQLRRSRDGRSEELLKGASAALAIRGSLRGALAAELLALGRDPRDPGTLASIGGMLAALGKPLDGLAYIARSTRVRGSRPALMGVREQAVALANQGFALVKLRRYAAAAAPLRRAIALQPDLAEAESTLGAALLCSGNRAAGFRALRAGAREQKYDVVITDEPTGLSRPTADRAIDTSHGGPPKRAAVTMPPLTYPSSTDVAPGLHDRYAQLDDAANNAGSAGTALVGRASAAFRTGLRHRSPATQMREYAILTAALGAYQEPSVKTLQQRVDATAHALSAANIPGTLLTDIATDTANCAGIEQCLRDACIPQATALNARFLPLQSAYDTAVRKLWAQEGRIMRGAAAASNDPNLQAYIRGHATVVVEALYSDILGTAMAWVGTLTAEQAVCIDGPQPAPSHGDAAPPAEKGKPCDKDPLSQSAFKVELGKNAAEHEELPFAVELTVSCDQLEAGASGGGLVGAFGKTQLTGDGGTFVVGARGGAFGADWESGVYVKTGPHGVEDFGWRTGPSVAVGTGERGAPIKIDPNFNQVDISFVGAVDYIPTAFGFTGGSPPVPAG